MAVDLGVLGDETALADEVGAAAAAFELGIAAGEIEIDAGLVAGLGGANVIAGGGFIETGGEQGGVVVPREIDRLAGVVGHARQRRQRLEILGQAADDAQIGLARRGEIVFADDESWTANWPAGLRPGRRRCG